MVSATESARFGAVARSWDGSGGMAEERWHGGFVSGGNVPIVQQFQPFVAAME